MWTNTATMKQHKKTGLIGGFLASTFIIYQLYIVVRIIFADNAFSIQETFLEVGYELSNVLILGVILLGPSLILLLTKEFKKNINWLGWAYILILIAGFLFLIYGIWVIKDPLAVGLPMLFIILPLLVLISIILLVFRKW